MRNWAITILLSFFTTSLYADLATEETIYGMQPSSMNPRNFEFAEQESSLNVQPENHLESFIFHTGIATSIASYAASYTVLSPAWTTIGWVTTSLFTIIDCASGGGLESIANPYNYEEQKEDCSIVSSSYLITTTGLVFLKKIEAVRTDAYFYLGTRQASQELESVVDEMRYLTGRIDKSFDEFVYAIAETRIIKNKHFSPEMLEN